MDNGKLVCLKSGVSKLLSNQSYDDNSAQHFLTPLTKPHEHGILWEKQQG